MKDLEILRQEVWRAFGELGCVSDESRLGRVGRVLHGVARYHEYDNEGLR
jgi:hypothetical protein